MNKVPNPETPAAQARLTISVREFCRLSSISRSKAYLLIKDGTLAVTHVGRRTLISYDSAIALIAPHLSEAYLTTRPAAASSTPASSFGEEVR